MVRALSGRSSQPPRGTPASLSADAARECPPSSGHPVDTRLSRALWRTTTHPPSSHIAMTFLTCAAPVSAAQVRGPPAGPLRAVPAVPRCLGGARECAGRLRTLTVVLSRSGEDIQGGDGSMAARFATLESYQLRRLKMAFFKGKRNTSIQELSKAVDLHRCVY